jgi:hypothetical protein
MRSNRVQKLCNLVLAALFVLAFSAAGSEGLWPIQSLPAEQIQKDWDFTPDAAWIENVQLACVKVTQQGAQGGGSGAFVSHNGLVVTNRHVVVDALSQLSTPTRDVVRDGMYAATPAEELDSGLEIHVLGKVMDVTPQAQKELGPTPGPNDVQRLQMKLQSRAPAGTTIDVVSYFGGAQYWLYVYQTFQAKLVFVPEESFAAFGGEDDNFCYPRHKLDIAFLRAYQNGKPITSAHMFPLSTTGPKDGEQLFAAGHPGFSQRHLPIAEIEYLRDVDLPLKVATCEAAVKAITAFMKSGDEQRKKGAGAFEHWANTMKIFQGALAFFKKAEVLDARRKLESQWREDLGKSKTKEEFLNAFADLEAARKDLTRDAAQRHFAALPQGELYGLASSLNHFAKVTRGKTDDEIQPRVKSFSNFLDHVLDPSSAPHVDVERVVLASWLAAAQQQLPAESPFIKAALNGQTPEEAAKHLLENAEQLTKKESMVALLTHGATSIDDAKIPLLKLIADLEQINHDEKAAAAEARCHTDLSTIERGLAEAYGRALAPEASSTLRLGWGRVQGYKEDGKDIPWSTTFASMIALSDTKEHKAPYILSEKFKAASKDLDLKLPLDFVSTCDGAPGSSGEPLFTREGNLVGVMFDGNQQEVPSIYSYIAPEMNGRSIAVDSAAIWAALEKVYDTKALVEELKAK